MEILSINNQKRIESNLPLDFNDMGIIEFINYKIKLNCIPQFNYENEIYYKIEYKEISKVLFDNRYTKDTIYRKVRKLSELGIIKPYCYNQTIGSSFFSITELFNSLTHDR